MNDKIENIEEEYEDSNSDIFVMHSLKTKSLGSLEPQKKYKKSFFPNVTIDVTSCNKPISTAEFFTNNVKSFSLAGLLFMQNLILKELEALQEKRPYNLTRSLA